MPTPLSTLSLGQGINSAGKLNDNSANGTNDTNHNLGMTKKWRTGASNTAEKEEQGAYKTHFQDKLGWQHALEGVLTTQWHTQQEQYWQQIKSQHSARWWTAEVIKKLWNVAWVCGGTEIMLCTRWKQEKYS